MDKEKEQRRFILGYENTSSQLFKYEDLGLHSFEGGGAINEDSNNS